MQRPFPLILISHRGTEAQSRASLFAGVLVIGGMSVSLYRQLQAAEKNDGPENQA